MKSQRDDLYDLWLRAHGLDGDSEIKAAWDEAWRAGMWAGIHENARLGIHVVELKEDIARLERRLDIRDDVEDETLEVSAYWHTDEPA